MKISSLPNLNRDTTSYTNFFTLFQDPNHHDDATLNKPPNIDHSQDTEPSETSPFKAPFVSFNEMDEDYYSKDESSPERNQMDQTLPGWPPSSNGSDANVSVGSNQFSSNIGARSEGPNFTSSVGSNQFSGAGSSKPPKPIRQFSLWWWRTTPTWTRTTSNLSDDGHAWRKYGQKLIPNATHPRNYYRCAHKFDQGCLATKKAQRTEEDPPRYQITYHGNHSCTDPPKAPHIILDSTIPNDSANSNFISFGPTHYPNTKLNHGPSYPTFPLVKQEYSHNQHELKPSLNHNQSTSIQLSDSMVFDSFWATPALASGSDQGDAIYSSGAESCMAIAHDDNFDDLDALAGDFW